MVSRTAFVKISAWTGILCCVGEFIALFGFAAFYPGYSHLKNTMSALGASASPVSGGISTWWICMGFLFIFFGAGVWKAFREEGAPARWAAILIMMYGFGEGFGSGVFKADHLETGLTNAAIIHDILGGIGVFAIQLLPLVMRKVIPRERSARFYSFSLVIFITGLFLLSLFLFRYLPNKDNFFIVYKGLWQRLFMLNTYTYLTLVAVIMLRRIRTDQQT